MTKEITPESDDRTLVLSSIKILNIPCNGRTLSLIRFRDPHDHTVHITELHIVHVIVIVTEHDRDLEGRIADLLLIIDRSLPIDGLIAHIIDLVEAIVNPFSHDRNVLVEIESKLKASSIPNRAWIMEIAIAAERGLGVVHDILPQEDFGTEIDEKIPLIAPYLTKRDQGGPYEKKT